MKDTFGLKLAKMRLERGLSQVDLTQHLKRMFPEARISQTSISMWEQRERPVNERALAMLSTFFAVSEDYWFNGSVEPGHLSRLGTVHSRLSAIYRDFKADLPQDAAEQLRDLIIKLHGVLLDGDAV